MELLLASVIGALLVFGLVNVFSGVFGVSSDLRRRAQLRGDADLAVTFLQRDVSRAEAVLTAPGSSLTFSSANGDTVHYAWSGSLGGSLTREINWAGVTTIAENVDSVSFVPLTLSRPFVWEKMCTHMQESIVAEFEEGDFDPWIVCCDCVDGGKREFEVRHRKRCAEEFWEGGTYSSVTRVAVMARAINVVPPPVNLRVDLHEADSSPNQYPGTLIATGTLDRMSLTTSWTWHDVTLTMVDTLSIVAGRRYWIVCRPDGAGESSYAGHVRYQKINNCTAWPQNGLCYRESEDGGQIWTSPSLDRELFFVLRGLKPVEMLDEVAEVRTDTTGIEYFLTLRKDDDVEVRTGQISFYDL